VLPSTLFDPWTVCNFNFGLQKKRINLRLTTTVLLACLISRQTIVSHKISGQWRMNDRICHSAANVLHDVKINVKHTGFRRPYRTLCGLLGVRGPVFENYWINTIYSVWNYEMNTESYVAFAGPNYRRLLTMPTFFRSWLFLGSPTQSFALVRV